VAGDLQRLVHELQVHQVELEVQNAELEDSRNRMEDLLEKYTDLYDFAPVGYFSLNPEGRIVEVNLTGAGWFGMERSRLVNQHFRRFVVPASRPIVREFLERVFGGKSTEVCEAALFRADGKSFWAGLHGTSAISSSSQPPWCRVAVSDITSLKQAEEAQNRMETLSVANQDLRREIVRRQVVERSLRKSEQNSSRLLEQSRQMQNQLRLLSRQVLSAQEEERKKISRELHDVIAQTLTSINVRLANLRQDAADNNKGLGRNIMRTQRLVEDSVNVVHRFARELRPAVLDDLGLIPALHAFVKSFSAQTGIRVHLSAFAAVEKLAAAKRTALYRVAQEALTNVARHARASKVDLRIEKSARAVSMTVTDDGKGFKQQSVPPAREGTRLGLLGMSERLEMIGGGLTITSAPGKGTTVLAQLPRSDQPRTKRSPGRNAGAKL
jgi:PAS domain S-box-containing protein